MVISRLREIDVLGVVAKTLVVGVVVMVLFLTLSGISALEANRQLEEAKEIIEEQEKTIEALEIENGVLRHRIENKRLLLQLQEGVEH